MFFDKLTLAKYLQRRHALTGYHCVRCIVLRFSYRFCFGFCLRCTVLIMIAHVIVGMNIEILCCQYSWQFVSFHLFKRIETCNNHISLLDKLVHRIHVCIVLARNQYKLSIY